LKEDEKNPASLIESAADQLGGSDTENRMKMDWLAGVK